MGNLSSGHSITVNDWCMIMTHIDDGDGRVIVVMMMMMIMMMMMVVVVISMVVRLMMMVLVALEVLVPLDLS